MKENWTKFAYTENYFARQPLELLNLESTRKPKKLLLQKFKVASVMPNSKTL